MAETCSNCKYFNSFGDTGTIANKGQCLFRLPSWIAENIDAVHDYTSARVYHKDYSCDLWKEKKNA